MLPHRVRVHENAHKDMVVYLRWRSGGNWKWKSLGITLRDERGRIRPEMRRMAIAEAQRQYEILSGRLTPTAETAPLTIGQTRDVLFAKDGLYPVLTPHAKEVAHALRIAERIWGAHTAWDAIDRSRLRMLARTRIDELRAAGLQGYRGAELVIQRVLAVANWLRDEQRIASDACLPPRRWRDELRSYWAQTAGAEPEAHRPRHTLAEMRQLLRVAHEVDPRFDLLMALGAELRLGQVARARRSDVDAEHRTLTIRGSGKKRGTVVKLTAGQWAVFEYAISEDGYLALIEGVLPDYPLFPQGKLVKGRVTPRHAERGSIERTAIKLWFREAERLANIPHITGRGAYGLRRIAVDAEKEMKISREGLKALGGWTDTQMPDSVYADAEAEYARDEAATIRARMRGETDD